MTMPKLLRLLAFMVIGVLLAPQPSLADNNYQQSENVWKLRDRCTQLAHKAFPDYTKESNAQREKYRAACLRANNLPVDPDPSAAGPAPDQAVRQK